MDKATVKSFGYMLLIFGLGLALILGGDRGFSAGIVSGLAYIGGFVLAFIGAYLAFVYGREKKQENV